MNAHADIRDRPRTVKLGPEPVGVNRSGRGPGPGVDVLVATTAVTSPALIAAIGWLYGGTTGLALAAPAATAAYVGIFLHDRLLVRVAMDGGRQTVGLVLRGLIPFAGTTLLSVPIMLKVFSDDINTVEAQRFRAVTTPIARRISREVDDETNEARGVLAAMRAERAGLRDRRTRLGEGFEGRLAAERARIATASEQVRAQTLVLRCEETGLRCAKASTGRPGLNGPVSLRAGALMRAAEEELVARERQVSAIDREQAATLAPLDARIARLDAPTGSGSIAEAEARVDNLSSGRDGLIALRLSRDADVVAASVPHGLGERLITLLTIVLRQPAILLLLLAAKVFLTVFELLGAMCGLRAARAIHAERLGYADEAAAVHARRLAAIERRQELALARLKARHGIWVAKRDIASAREFDRFNGVGASLRRAMGTGGCPG